MNNLPNIHPGEILKEEFLDPMNISAYRLSKESGLTETRISQIIHGKRSITPETALALSSFFGTSPEFWLNLQNHYDLEELKANKPELLMRVSRFKVDKERTNAKSPKNAKDSNRKSSNKKIV